MMWFVTAGMDQPPITSATYRDKTCGIELLVYIDPKWLHHPADKNLGVLSGSLSPVALGDSCEKEKVATGTAGVVSHKLAASRGKTGKQRKYL